MKKVVILLILVIVFIGIKLTFFYPANDDVTMKLRMIKDEISKRGYNNNWFIISSKRSDWYNKILANSAKDSYHLYGKAIDIYVIDINGDYKFDNEDIKIFKSANEYIEKLYPNLIGRVGTYRSKGYFTRHMIHVDVSGINKDYNN